MGENYIFVFLFLFKGGLNGFAIEGRFDISVLGSSSELDYDIERFIKFIVN